MTTKNAFSLACEQYAKVGVDARAALDTLAKIQISLHCWQGDDVTGFEAQQSASGGGIMATGNYPGKARTIDELRQDLDKAASLIPGRHRLNLHAMYLDNGGKSVDRDAIEPGHFQSWCDWAKNKGMGLDFNGSFFAHPMADSGFTLSSADRAVREFWIEHGKRCRTIAAHMGRETGSPCVTNVWIPDGYKDTPVDRHAPRQRLRESLDTMFAESLPEDEMLDAVESKLFGIGSESYVVGSFEFYLGYAIQNRKLLCLDAGHFHPTESVADKVSSVIDVVPGILLHASRGVRWDSDHVVTLNDDLRALTEEIVRSGALSRIHVGLDFFDASINRIAAWVIGTRNTQKALLLALLQPLDILRKAESSGDLTQRLNLLEECQTLPWGIVWDQFCEEQSVPGSLDYLPVIRDYEKQTSARG